MPRVETETNMRSGISFITSARNEQEGIPLLADYIKALKSACPIDCEFIVLDNNSSDQTFSEMNRFFEQLSYLRSFKLTSSESYRDAIFFALRESKFENVFLFPSDLQHPVEDSIRVMFAFLAGIEKNKEYAIFTYRRRLDGTFLKFRGIIFRFFVKLIRPSLLSDPSSPLKALSKVPDLVPSTEEFLLFDIGIQLKWIQHGYSYSELPVFFVPRRTGSSNFRFNPKKILLALRHLYFL